MALNIIQATSPGYNPLKYFSDANYYLKRSFTPYQEGELRPDLLKPLIGFFALFMIYFITFFALVMVIHDLIRPPKPMGFFERIGFSLSTLLHTTLQIAHHAFLFFMTPVLLVRPILRLLITAFKGWGPSAVEALKAAVKSNDVTAIRNFPRLMFMSEVELFSRAILEKRISGFPDNRDSIWSFINGKDPTASSARALAIELGHKEVYQALLQTLHCASTVWYGSEWDYICQKDNVEFAKIYLENHPIKARADDPYPIARQLKSAITHKALGIIGLILNAHPPQKFTADETRDIFNAAFEIGSINTVNLLFNRGFKVEDGEQKRKLLEAACRTGNKAIVESLIQDRGCSVDLDSESKTKNSQLLFNACESGSLELVRWLIDIQGLDVNDEHDLPDFKTKALYYACKSGSLELVQYLVDEKHLDPRSVETTLPKSKEATAENPESNPAKLLAEPMPNGSTALHIACQPRYKAGFKKATVNHELIRYLLSKGLSLSTKGSDGKTALTHLLESIKPDYSNASENTLTAEEQKNMEFLKELFSTGHIDLGAGVHTGYASSSKTVLKTLTGYDFPRDIVSFFLENADTRALRNSLLCDISTTDDQLKKDLQQIFDAPPPLPPLPLNAVAVASVTGQEGQRPAGSLPASQSMSMAGLLFTPSNKAPAHQAKQSKAKDQALQPPVPEVKSESHDDGPS